MGLSSPVQTQRTEVVWSELPPIPPRPVYRPLLSSAFPPSWTLLCPRPLYLLVSRVQFCFDFELDHYSQCLVKKR